MRDVHTDHGPELKVVLINTEESEGRSWKAFVDALAITNHTREESELL